MVTTEKVHEFMLIIILITRYLFTSVTQYRLVINSVQFDNTHGMSVSS